MDPLWNSIIVAGFRDGKAYLGASTMLGVSYEENFLASGIGAHLALPLLRKGWKADMTEAEARKLLEDCMRVLFYRDTRASPKITIGKANSSGASVSEPFTLETYWEYPAFARGNKAGDGSW
uniref:Proteasome subunit beta type-4 n=1 Tax=Favella ehrenbergii TaxID=182087 RepID=A0A7S3I7R9_9SPIT|mmetsp:Transcript_4356/g.5361  ORF Transcript_4356/g.5361 Transcript_4356/m.5361 type:complete len:122 (+) Transcript_4356:3-368(+)